MNKILKRLLTGVLTLAMLMSMYILTHLIIKV